METKTEENDSRVPGVQAKGTTTVFDNVSQSGIKKLCPVTEAVVKEAAHEFVASVQQLRTRPTVTEEPLGTPKIFPKVCLGCGGSCSGSPGSVANCTRYANERRRTLLERNGLKPREGVHS